MNLVFAYCRHCIIWLLNYTGGMWISARLQQTDKVIETIITYHPCSLVSLLKHLHGVEPDCKCNRKQMIRKC